MIVHYCPADMQISNERISKSESRYISLCIFQNYTFEFTFYQSFKKNQRGIYCIVYICPFMSLNNFPYHVFKFRIENRSLKDINIICLYSKRSLNISLCIFNMIFDNINNKHFILSFQRYILKHTTF